MPSEEKKSAFDVSGAAPPEGEAALAGTASELVSSASAAPTEAIRERRVLAAEAIGHLHTNVS